MVTIATNMAGRGTDILLGGNSDFVTSRPRPKNMPAPSRRRGRHQAHSRPGMVRFYYSGQEFETTKPLGTRQLPSTPPRPKTNTTKSLTLGGLHILGTERHESRRVDNQLRGRAGRQGDPGSSRFYLSLEDDLMRIFARQWVSGLLQRLGMEEGVPIESQHDHRPYRRRRRSRSNRKTSSPANTCSNTTTS